MMEEWNIGLRCPHWVLASIPIFHHPTILLQEEDTIEPLLHAATEVGCGGSGAGGRHVGRDIGPVGAYRGTLELQPVGTA